jgi:bifunctional DNA-binding transcriptional regulator/antitoxin component of YhaV-PrlF toxin-antitoxin module
LILKDVKIISIDNRGRIVLPLVTRKNLGLTTNSQLMLVSDSETKEIRITPIGLRDESNLVKVRVIMKDVPGALAKLLDIFAEEGLSLVYSEAVIVEKDKTAVWTAISENPRDLERLTKILKERGEALEVDFSPLD